MEFSYYRSVSKPAHSSGLVYFSLIFVHFYIIYYDYIYYLLSETFNDFSSLFRLLFEPLIVIGFIFYILKYSKLIVVSYLPYILLFHLIIFLFVGLLSDNSYSYIATDMRSHITPILVLLFFLNLFRFSRINIEHLFWILLVLISVSSVYAIYEYWSYEGDYMSGWRYHHLSKMYSLSKPDFDLGRLKYQFERDEALRAGGFFDSALNAAYIFYLSTCFSIYLFFVKMRERKLVLVLLAAFFFNISCLALYATQVRIVIIMLIVTVIGWGAIHCCKKQMTRWLPFILIINLSPAVIFGYLIAGFEFMSDESSRGRLNQYVEVLSTTNLFGGGLGERPGTYDSLVLELVISMGIVGALIWLLLMLLLMHKVISLLRKMDVGPNLFGLLFGLILSFWLLMFFQHTAGSSYHLILMVLFGWVMSLPPCSRMDDIRAR